MGSSTLAAVCKCKTHLLGGITGAKILEKKTHGAPSVGSRKSQPDWRQFLFGNAERRSGRRLSFQHLVTVTVNIDKTRVKKRHQDHLRDLDW